MEHSDYRTDFQDTVKSLISPISSQNIRKCYGISNSARFVFNGFLIGIPNLDNLDASTEQLCVFSKVQSGPGSELHIALLIKSDILNLVKQLNWMLELSGNTFSSRNQNCALFLAQNGKIYPHNNSKDIDDLTQEVLGQLGTGVNPDVIFVSIYGKETEAERGAITQIEELIDRQKLKVITQRLSLLSFGQSLSKTVVDEFVKCTSDAHLTFDSKLTLRFSASLESKRFLVLTGLAGSGKTKLAQAFARWLSPSSDCYRLIAVGADWTGNENVLGYPNGLDDKSYITKPALDLILHARDNQEIPHFLILDEMNLSHVERYFADILSAIESDEKIHLHRDAERKANNVVIPSKIQLPPNLFIIGTVNVDETTYMFSPKVLDRANVIEFRMEAEELASFLSSPKKPDLSKLDGKGAGFGQAFVNAAKGPADVPIDAKDAFEQEMLLFFKVMQEHRAEFGYRVAHEAARFIYFYKLLGNYTDVERWFPGAFDCVVMQKFLPKLHGSRARLGPLLKALWFLCINNADGRGNNPLEKAKEVARSTDRAIDPSTEIPDHAPYPVSAEKIARMWRLLHENGFASFAEA